MSTARCSRVPFIAAFSRESVDLLKWPGHRYASFNAARDDLARHLGAVTSFKPSGYVPLGNAAAAFLVTRESLPAGSARMLGFQHKTLAEHYDLCSAPIDGHFVSRSKELFALAVHVPGEVQRLLTSAGWKAEDVDHYIFHQPSQAILERVFDAIGARPEACVHTHSVYGNTASTSWAVALNHRLKHGTINNGDKLVIASAASGFTVVCASAVWES